MGSEDDAFDALLGMVARAADVRPDLKPGDQVGEHFEVVGTLGRGGMGVVYRGRDLRLDREVALKVARTSGASERGRLHREAKALAKLAHPHVVTVFEVGELDDGEVYIAMEHVDGGTMRDYLSAQPRSLDEKRRILLEAGRGLQAAHAEGLVHRDFKPENVLIGRDGRARVSDFGLARNQPTAEAIPGDLALDELASLGIGTPGYMAPEQMRGRPVDARVDQYAFAIVCYEVLVGASPFHRATTVDGVLDAMMKGPGAHGAPSKSGGLAATVEHVLERALAHDPEDRHADLTPLLSALEVEPSPRKSRWRRTVLGAALLTGIGVAALWISEGPQEDCDAMGRSLRDTWRTEARRALEAQRPDPEVDRALTLMDDYADLWSRERTRTCRERPQNETQHRERRACLDDLARSYRAAAAVLASSRENHDRLRGPNRLFAPALCNNEAFARARAPAPSENHEAVGELRATIAQVRALEDAAQYEAAAGLAATATAEAEALAYEPAVVEALYARGRVEARRGEFTIAAKTLEQAYLLARRAPHDRLAAEIGGELAYVHGFNLSDIPTAKRWADLALADMDRLGGAGPFEVRVLTNVGSANAWSGELEQALAQHQRALELAIAHRGEDHFEVALVRVRLGETLASKNQSKKAVTALEAAIKTLEHSLGTTHPELVRPLTKLGLVKAEQGDIKRAVALCQRAAAVAEQTLGERHANTGLAHMNLGVVYLHAGQKVKAVEAYVAAVGALEAALDADHPDVALAQTNLGLAYEENGQFARALEMHEKALDVQRRRLGPDHPSLVPTLVNQISALLGLKRFADAKPLARTALRICEASYPRGIPFALFSLGQAQLGTDDVAGAVTSFDRALDLRRKTNTPARYLAETLLYAARAERALGERPTRADALAREGLTVLGDQNDDTAQRIRRDLKAFLAVSGGH